MISRNKIIMFIIVLAFFGVFAGALWAADANHQHDHANDFSFSTFSLIRFLGACALVCASGSFLSAIFRKKLSRHFLKMHRILGWLTIIFALSHGISMMVFF